MTGDLKIGDNNLIGLKNLTDYKVDDPLHYRIRDFSSAVNKEYLNTKFLKKMLIIMILIYVLML